MNFSCTGLKEDLALRYEVLLQMAPFGFLLIDLSGVIVEVNQQAVNIFGSPSIEETKHVNMLSYPPLEDAGVSQLIRDAIGSKEPIQKTFTYTSKWDKTNTMKCTACSILDSNDNVCFVAFLIEDVSQLEQLKDKYFRIARTLASVVDSIESHYIWAKDSDGKYQMVSQSYANLFNMTPRQMMDLTDYDLFDKEMAEAFIKDDNEVLSSCGLKEVSEIVNTPLMGPRRWRTIKNAICDEAGKGVISVGIAEDVTEEYERRKAAREAINELEAFVKRVIR